MCPSQIEWIFPTDSWPSLRQKRSSRRSHTALRAICVVQIWRIQWLNSVNRQRLNDWPINRTRQDWLGDLVPKRSHVQSRKHRNHRNHWSKRSENSLASRLVQNVQIGTAKKCSKLLELLRAQYCLVKQCWLSRGLLLSVLRFYPTSDFITKMEWTNTAHDLTSLGISCCMGRTVSFKRTQQPCTLQGKVHAPPLQSLQSSKTSICSADWIYWEICANCWKCEYIMI